MSSATHGRTGEPIYEAWRAMIRRCSDPRLRCYREYGGRGITVCARWRESFESFLEDMGERPSGASLDRIDNDLLVDSYNKANCRWATRCEQQRNTRATRLTAADVQEIHGRIEHGESKASVARRFALTPSHVWQVRSGDLWRDQLKGPTV